MKIGISLPVRELKDDLGAIKEFAQAADGLGYTHLRVPEVILRPGGGYMHEPLTLLAFVAGITRDIELVPSVIILPSRQTVLVAKQVAELDVLSEGRIRLGVGVGGSQEEYTALGANFAIRGDRCEEQIQLLKRLWTEDTVNFAGKWDTVSGAGLNPLPIQRPVPIWIGASALPIPRIRRRVGGVADGWFVLCPPEEYPFVQADILRAAKDNGRRPEEIGTEAGVAVVGSRESEWRDRVIGWQKLGLTHLCLRTLGGNLDAKGHLRTMERVYHEVPRE